jgi:rhodanese-related sulfurtransferase
MKRPISLVAVVSILCLFTTLAFGAEQAAEKPAWWYKNIVDAAHVSQYATIPPKEDVVIVDSRPSRKYDKGHVVPSISIPDREFEKMTGLLPENKASQLIFYCGGLKCPLSHKSAAKAEALGYTNVAVYAAGYPDWVKNGHVPGVSTAYVKTLIDKKASAVIIDARPARKFDKGHVPTAINIPLRQFEEMKTALPADKSTELIYYCGGYKCPLSPKSAAKAIEAGYTNVRLFQAGYPAWKEAYGAMPEKAASAAPAAAGPMVEVGEDEGTISIASFNKLATENPGAVHWYDVRDPEEVEADGTFSEAVVMTVDEVDENVGQLPSDKPIVFFCSTGARSGEAYDIVRMKRDDLKVYFLEANVAFNKDGSVPKATPAD